MKAICVACGTQHAESAAPPECCAICDDERQYVPDTGQAWTTLEELRDDHRNVVREVEPGLTGIGTEPSFAIGQRALLVESPGGNVLWDCITLLDDETMAAVNDRGGIAAVAISHPHYYSSMVEWSHAFDGAPIHLHAADRQWVMRPDPALRFWEGSTESVGAGMTLVRCGGHFAGGTVLHWAGGAEGRGALLSGDIVQVIPDRSHVGFMYSYPNLIPLPAREIDGIEAALEPFAYDRIYGAWWDRIVPSGAKENVRRSAERYRRAISP